MAVDLISPSAIPSNALAEIVGAGVENVQFQPGANILPRKILIVGTFDDTITNPDFDEDKPNLVLSAEEVGARTGYGFPLHRMAQKCFAGSRGIPTYIAPLDQSGGTAATGDITITSTPATVAEASTLHMYVAGDYVPVALEAGDDRDDIATKIDAAIDADPNLPITAVVNGVTTYQVDVTTKSKGTPGNTVEIGFNFGFNQKMPLMSDGSYLVAVITNPSGGATNPSVNNLLINLGQGDERNSDHFTDIVCGFSGDDGVNAAQFRDYNGIGNDFVGDYAKPVARPFRVFNGNTGGGSATLATLIAFADTNKYDRTNAFICVPDSPSHDDEIAALACGIAAYINNNRAEESYEDQILPGIWPAADPNDNWCNLYSNRDLAVKSGISPTVVQDGVVKLSNIVSMYRPDNVPVTSNGYRSFRNLSIIQNILFNNKLNFSQEKWKGISIVEDVTNVSNFVDRQKARDISSVIDDLVALANAYAGNAWLFTAAFTIAQLQAGGKVVIRDGGTGFNILFPVIFSGEGGIIDHTTQFDISLAVLL
jgi:phage tail sheath gpL-like